MNDIKLNKSPNSNIFIILKNLDQSYDFDISKIRKIQLHNPIRPLKF